MEYLFTLTPTLPNLKIILLFMNKIFTSIFLNTYCHHQVKKIQYSHMSKLLFEDIFNSFFLSVNIKKISDHDCPLTFSTR